MKKLANILSISGPEPALDRWRSVSATALLVLTATTFAFAAPKITYAQADSEAAAEEEPVSEGDGDAEAGLLTSEELQNLVAPVALYPDTLLIQIFVASTVPLDVMKADRFLKDNADREPAELEAEIDSQGWDASVAVLATAFPEVIGEMAVHVDWTETMGTAMLAQSEDVLDSVQVMRDNAINTGALVSGPEQTVEEIDENVVITPTDPEVVYVPQYEPEQVYYGPSTGDILGATLLTFGTIAVIDSIFDDDDDWNDYWGCRNCGGWGGGPIINDPKIDIDVDRNVNIDKNIDLGDRTDIGWKPDKNRADDARKKLDDRKRPDAKPGKLPVNRKEGRTNELRNQLSDRSGAPDISRDRGGAAAAVGAGAGVAAGSGLSNRASGDRKKTADKARAVDKSKARPDKKKAPVKAKPKATKKPTTKKKTASAHKSKGSAMKKHSGGNRARSASSRGKKSHGRKRR